jgi:uncharacterized protein
LSVESDGVRILREGYEAFNRGDFEAVIELMHPDIEMQRARAAPDPEPVRGAEAIRAWMMPDIFDEQHVDLVEIVENGDKIFVEGKFRVRARGSGIEINDRAFHVWTIRDGKAARLEFYADRSEALQAAGLTAAGGSAASDPLKDFSPP